MFLKRERARAHTYTRTHTHTHTRRAHKQLVLCRRPTFEAFPNPTHGRLFRRNSISQAYSSPILLPRIVTRKQKLAVILVFTITKETPLSQTCAEANPRQALCFLRTPNTNRIYSLFSHRLRESTVCIHEKGPFTVSRVECNRKTLRTNMLSFSEADIRLYIILCFQKYRY